MSRPFQGVVNIDIKDSVPDWEPYTQPMAPEGAPNVLYVVLDDVGFSAMEPYGGLIETPNIKRIADRGLTYTNFHTTALCSPTRSCLLTGRNHTTNGMGCITEATSGFPNANGHIPFECANLAEVLGERGWNTYTSASGTSCAEDEMNLASSKRQWPLGRGFERYYGFLGGETNQWYPDLVYDNHPVASPPHRPRRATTSRVDLTDKAIEFIRDAKAIAPDKPFFLYYCPGAAHAPAPRAEGVGRPVQGPLRHGLRGVPRARVRAPEGAGDRRRRTPSSRRSTRTRTTTSHDGKPWSEIDRVRPWDSLSRRRAAAVRAHGRGLRRLPQPRRPRARPPARLPRGVGQLDNTIVVLVSDNGASGEGGPNGSVNENKFFNGVPDTIEENLKYLDELGGTADLQPLPDRLGVGVQHAVQDVEALRELRGRHGRPAASSPGRRASRDRGEIRRQYCHAIDIVPTLYEASGVEHAGGGQRLHPEAARGRQLRRDASTTPTRATPQGDAVLLDARHAGDLAQGLEGGDRGARGARLVGRLPPAALGALRHRGGPERVATTSRPSTRRSSRS